MATIVTTPKGKAVYPRIDTPDTKFDPNGVYTCKLHVSEDEFNAFSKRVTDVVNAAYDDECRIKGKKIKVSENKPIRITAEGDYEIYAKQVAKRDTRKGVIEFSVPAFDSKGHKIDPTPAVGSGSTVKMSCEIYTWFSDMQGFGYTLRLKAVQILDLIEYQNGSANAYGFDSEEEGYVTDGESLDTAFETEQATF